jgi:hypothetical protein
MNEGIKLENIKYSHGGQIFTLLSSIHVATDIQRAMKLTMGSLAEAGYPSQPLVTQSS